MGGRFDAIVEVLSRFKFMPFLVLAAQLCPKGIEATFFALLMSISNAAGATAMAIGAMAMRWVGLRGDMDIDPGNVGSDDVTGFEGLATLIIARTVCAALPLLFLNLVPNVTSVNEEPSRRRGSDDHMDAGKYQTLPQ